MRLDETVEELEELCRAHELVHPVVLLLLGLCCSIDSSTILELRLGGPVKQHASSHWHTLIHGSYKRQPLQIREYFRVFQDIFEEISTIAFCNANDKHQNAVACY